MVTHGSIHKQIGVAGFKPERFSAGSWFLRNRGDFSTLLIGLMGKKLKQVNEPADVQ